MLLPLAVQLYSFRDPKRFGGSGMGLDLENLAAIAEAGFLGVETVDVPGGDPVAAGRALADLGLAVTSSHSWADWADPEPFARAADGVARLGSARIIVSGRGAATVDELHADFDRLAAAAEVARQHGLRLGYHNHSAELAELDGRPVIDRMAEAFGDALDLQVDIFWAVVGGADPAAVIDRLGSRVVSLHLKDGVDLPAEAYDDAPYRNVAIGSGVVDPAPSVAAAGRVGSVEWLIVEFDQVDGPVIAAARASLEHLVAHGLGRGRTA